MIETKVETEERPATTQDGVMPFSLEFLNLVAMDLANLPEDVAVGFKALIHRGEDFENGEVRIMDVQVIPVQMKEQSPIIQIPGILK